MKAKHSYSIISRNTLKLGDKNKVDSSISERGEGCKTSVSFAGLVSYTVAWRLLENIHSVG